MTWVVCMSTLSGKLLASSLAHRQCLAPRRERARSRLPAPPDGGEPLPADGEVALPLGVAGVGGGELVGDVLGGGVGLERAWQVALGLAHVAEPVPADREVALPLGVAGVARRQSKNTLGCE